MTIAQQALSAVSISQPAGKRIVVRTKSVRQTVATTEPTLMPKAR